MDARVALLTPLSQLLVRCVEIELAGVMTICGVLKTYTRRATLTVCGAAGDAGGMVRCEKRENRSMSATGDEEGEV